MKKIYLFLFAILLITGIFFYNSNSVSAHEATIYKSASCGCCVGHAGFMEKNDFSVKTIFVEDQSIKEKYNVPQEMRSCHTYEIEGYFVEGHVPIEAINKLLEERPNIDGIAVPGMPSGSPGMPGIKRAPFVVYQIKDGKYSEYMRV